MSLRLNLHVWPVACACPLHFCAGLPGLPWAAGDDADSHNCLTLSTEQQVALATRSQFSEARSLPNPGEPALDAQGRLLVGAAVGTREGDKDRVAQLVAAGEDGSQGSVANGLDVFVSWHPASLQAPCSSSASAHQHAAEPQA